MAELQKRFIYALNTNWYGSDNGKANEELYSNSVVFIHDVAGKGIAIWAQGSYFEMNNNTDVKNIINNYLVGKNNIVVKVENDTLTISETSVSSLTGKTESTELVQAKAVAKALTTPIALTMSLSDETGAYGDGTKATFSETFTTLDGKTTDAVTTVLKEGSNIKFSKDTDGLVVSAENTTYTAGTGLTLNGTEFNHTNAVTVKTIAGGETVTLSSTDKDFKYDQFTYDAQGHITGVTERTITLPDTAFKNDNTTYDLDATANATKGVDVNLKGNDTTTDTVTFVGGSNVEVSLKDGKVEISSSFENDNTTYTGENAIVVTQPEEGQTEGKVTLKIDETEKVLTQSASGLKTNLVIDYVTSTNKIRLTNGTDVISEFDASAFVKDSFLKGVEIATLNESGVAGNYLKFTFETVDTDGTGDPEDSTKVIYVDIQEFYVKTTVSGDELTYSSVANTGNDYKVSNVLGTITRNNTSNTITVSKDGLATVADIKNVLETIDSDLDVVKPEGSNENEIAVVTGITQVDGKITIIDSGLAATKAYVDGAITGLDSELTASSEYFTKVVITDGKLDTNKSTKANISEAELVNYTNTSTQNYVNILATDTINEAFDKCNSAWDWITI